MARIFENSTSNVDIGDVQLVLYNIINVRSPSPLVTASVINTVNSILSANISSESANASSGIVKSVEKQVAYTIERFGKFSSVKPNIAVEGVTVNKTQVRSGIGFTVDQTEAGFREDGSRSLNPEDLQTANQVDDTFIQLPNDAIFEDGNVNGIDVKVSFIVYNDNKLFQSELLEQESNASMVAVVGPIISAVVLDKDVANLTTPVAVQIVPTQVIDKVALKTSKCVYWDFSKRGGIGDWAEDGCELNSTESGKITCYCDHLTSFAVLVDFSGVAALSFTLDLISTVGCAVSIIGLCLTLLIFLCCRGLRVSLQRKILIQLCISMLGLYLSFWIGIDYTDSEIGCLIVAVCLHYFVITTVVWMGVEARHMYITLVSDSGRVGRKFMIKAALFAWGAGLIPVAVVLGINLSGSKRFDHLAASYCFLAPGSDGLFYGLLLPVGLVILHNTITFCLIARNLLGSRAYVKKPSLKSMESETGDGEVFQKTGVREISQRLLNAFAVSILLGLTWVFGFLAIEEAQVAFQLLFCIFNSFQGLFVCIFFCFAQRDVRRLVCARCFPSPPSQPRVQKVNKPVVTGVTSVSDDTRVSGEIYTEDNDTMATTIDGITMTVLDSETIHVDSKEDY